MEILQQIINAILSHVLRIMVTHSYNNGTLALLNISTTDIQPLIAGASVTMSPVNMAISGFSDFSIVRIVLSVSAHFGEPDVQCKSVN